MPESVPAEVDSSRLGQALVNLLANASKYSVEGDVIELTLETDGDSIRLTIQDHGPGIAPEDHARIFAPYERGSGAPPNTRGLGLGLSVALSVAHLHGGTITVESALGQGAAFVVTLPNTRRNA
jgi:signal transduction histidine kinase